MRAAARGAALAAGLLLAAPAAHAAEPIGFAYFRSLCLEHRGKPDEAVQAADAAGWMPVPRSLIPELPPPMTDGALRLRTTTEAFDILMAGHASMPIGRRTLAMTFCAVMQMPAQDDAMVEAVEDWVGLAPSETDEDGTRIYMFAEEGGKRRRITSDAEAVRRIESGSVTVVMAKRDEDGAMVGVMVPVLRHTAQAAR